MYIIKPNKMGQFCKDLFAVLAVHYLITYSKAVIKCHVFDWIAIPLDLVRERI
jgi:hypothetical protein